MGRTVGVALEGDRRHGDDRGFGEPILQLGVLGFAVGQPQTPPVVVDDDVEMIRVLKRRRAAIKGGIVKAPLRRSRTPNQPGKVTPVLVVTGPAAVGGEVVLIPPLELSVRRQRQLAGLLAANQVPAHRDEPLAALGPQRRHDVGIRAPQSKPAKIAPSISSTSNKAMTSSASAACSPLRNVSPDRNRVVPKPRKYGMIA